MNPRKTVLTVLATGAGLCLLLAVFALYLQPDFLRTLADQLWACF